MDFEGLAGAVYRRVQKEQESEVGAWFDLKKEKTYHALFTYVESKYRKVQARCPLHKHLESTGLLIRNKFSEFVALSSSRDRMGRAMKLKRFDKLGKNQYLRSNFAYIRRFILKKFMVLHVLDGLGVSCDPGELIGKDFGFKFIREVFDTMASIKAKTAAMHTEEESMSMTMLSGPELCLGEASPGPSKNWSKGLMSKGGHSETATTTVVDEYIPKSKN